MICESKKLAFLYDLSRISDYVEGSERPNIVTARKRVLSWDANISKAAELNETFVSRTLRMAGARVLDITRAFSL